MGTTRAPRSTARLFAIYAVITLLPVLALGVVLAASFSHDTNQSGVAEGRAEAIQVAQTGVEPLLSGHSLGNGLTARERAGLRRLAKQVVGRHEVLRLRVRDLGGVVVFSDDGSGFGGKPDDEAVDAAHGKIIADLTHLNADGNDSGPVGVAAVEAYVPLRAGVPARALGAMELYLPYAPISRDLTAGLHRLYVDLAIGLAALYLILFAITASVSRGLRRESALNAHLAHYDTLTELPNRTVFHSEAERAVASIVRRGRPVAIAIIDLDHFKNVNDALGHHNGDRLLTELARRLAAAMGPLETVARLGGDEFGVIIRDASDAEQVLRRLRDVVEREFEVDGLPLSVQASIGFVIAPHDGTDVHTLLQRADVAMYMAKAQHVGALRYDAALDHYDAASLGLLGELRHAIDGDQLVLHYQPKTTIADGRVDAVEALVRWQHPKHGLLAPDKFLPLAEQTDLIDKLTTWVLRTALTQIRDLGPRASNMSVAVNVSARSVGRMALADEVIETLDRLGMPAERLIIEVTETALLSDPKRAAAVLDRLAAAGVDISLDDFGRGQTSLGYLSALPISELKIDRSFLADMLDNRAHAAIVRSIIDLGHNLDLRVVGEGVENEDMLAALRAARCDLAQGFLLARPMPLDRLAQWLEPLAAPQAVAVATPQAVA